MNEFKEFSDAINGFNVTRFNKCVNIDFVVGKKEIWSKKYSPFRLVIHLDDFQRQIDA